MFGWRDFIEFSEQTHPKSFNIGSLYYTTYKNNKRRLVSGERKILYMEGVSEND